MTDGSLLSGIERLVATSDRHWDRMVGMPRSGAKRAGRFPWPRHLVAALAIAGYAGFDAARRGLDDAMAKIHAPGQRGFGVNSLHDGTATARRALAAWREGNAAFAPFLRMQPISIARIETVLELVLAVFTAVLLYGVLRYLRNQIDEAAGVLERPDPYRVVLCVASAAVLAYFVLGLVDQLLELELVLADSVSGPVAAVLKVSSIVRRLSLALVLVPGIVSSLVLARNHWKPVQALRSAGTAYRVLVTLAVVHFVLLTASVPAEQSRDAIRLWPVHGWLAVWGVLATSFFSFSLAVLALRLGADGPRHAGELLSKGATHGLAAAGAAIVAIGVALHVWASWGSGLTALGIVLLAVAVLSLPILYLLPHAKPASPGARSAGERARLMVPALLSMLPMVALERAVVSSTMPDLIARREARWLLLVATIVFGLAVFAYMAARWYGDWATRTTGGRQHAAARRQVFLTVLAGVGLLALGVAVWARLDPFRHGRTLGVHGLLGTFLTLATVVAGAAGFALEGRPIPASLDFLGLRRIPIIGGIVVWGLLGNVLPDGHFHEVRIVRQTGASATPPGRSTLTASAAFERWVGVNLPDASLVAPSSAARDVPGVPLVFIAAAGGGIRAATFTALAIDCVFLDIDPKACASDDTFVRRDGWTSVFAASGASGGSVGIASVIAERSIPDVRGDDWVRTRLGTDLLSPELAWQLLVEAPNTLLAFNGGTDRAAVLERTWERRFDDHPDAAQQPFYALSGAEGWPQPLLYLNGTNVIDGCRVTISSARASADGHPDTPAVAGSSSLGSCSNRRVDGSQATLGQTVSRDLSDYLCGDEDVRLSTAAFLSARFPMVSPTGVVAALRDRRPGCLGGAASGYGGGELSVGDAGYRDNTGAAALTDLWGELAPVIAAYNRSHDRCVVPLLVEIDNGHRNLGAAAAPAAAGSQLLAPLSGALRVFSTRDAGPIEQLAAMFTRPLDRGVTATIDGAETARYARLSLYEHPGVLAPLGWSLSRAAVDDLAGQLDVVADNRNEVAAMGRWLQPDTLRCQVAAGG